MSVRVAHRRAYNNIWSKKKNSSKSSSSSTTTGNTDEDKPISYFRKKAQKASSAVAKNHPSYGKGKLSSSFNDSSDITLEQTRQTKKAKYYVSKNAKLAYGSSKKGGGGGAYTWGKPGDEFNIPELDPNDPNYDRY